MESTAGASSIYTDNTSIMHNPNYETFANVLVDDYRPLKPYEYNDTLPSFSMDAQDRFTSYESYAQIMLIYRKLLDHLSFFYLFFD